MDQNFNFEMQKDNQKLHNKDFAESNRYLAGIRDNDRAVIEEIYSRFSKDIERMVINNNGTAEDARDVFQEVLISIFRQAHNGLELRCAFYTFLYLACKKRWFTQMSSKYNSKTSYGEDQMQNILSINEQVNYFFQEDERMNLICEKLKMMNDGCREVIELSWKTDDQGKHLSWMEIASILEVSYAYIRKKASECKGRLAELVKKDIRYKEMI